MRLSLAAIEQAQAAIRAGGNHNAESVHGSPGVRRVVMRVCVCAWPWGSRPVLKAAGGEMAMVSPRCAAGAAGRERFWCRPGRYLCSARGKRRALPAAALY